MAPREELSLRDAGSRIASSGLVDDVVATNGREPAQRQRGKSASDADSRRDERDDVAEYGDEGAEYDEDDREDADEADEDGGSNRDESEEAEDSGDDADGQSEEEDGDEPEPREATHKVKVQGKTFEVTTSELVAGYQRSKDYQLKTQKLSQTAREYQAGHQKVAEQYQRKLHALNSVNQDLVKLLAGDINSPAMEQLRASDPTQYMLQRQLYQDKVERIQAVISTLNNESERHIADVEATRKGDTARLIAYEREKLVAAIPDWDGQDGKPGAKHKVQEFLVGLGFSPDELNTVYDARMLVVADMARRFVEMAKKRSQPVKHTAKRPPKIVKPGASQIRKGQDQQRQQQGGFRKAKDQAKRTGNMRDAGKAISHLL